ncbi:MAG TPA: T9SS type A sorting domain-containing protein, partial [candidate division WOR-3 bacterium]|nr:T9SS type A sorting domain-containing protein [candidate division WOR-3 bacterium]
PDHDAGFIDAQPGDTIGIGIVADNGSSRIGGWYPQDFQVYTANLSLYAKLVLGIMPGVEENIPSARSLIFAPAFSRGRATIKMSLPDTRHVKLVIYDPAGRRVKTLVNKRLEKGVHYFSFKPIRAGIYILKAEIGSMSYTKKMGIIK